MKPRNRHLALVLSGLAICTFLGTGTAAAARPLPSPTGVYIVRVRVPAGEPGTVGIGGRRVDAGLVRHIDRSIEGLEARIGFRAALRFHHALQGFAARLSPLQAAAVRADAQVTSVRPAAPVEPATSQVYPSGVKRVGATPPSGGGSPPDLSTVNVATLDTGIRNVTGDPELNVKGGTNCSMDGQGEDVWGDRDPSGHGTHVAGIIGAADNTIGAVGVAPGVALWSVRIFDGVVGTDATVICGLDWVTTRNTDLDLTNDIDVVNMSIRGPRPLGDHEASCFDPGDDEHEAICATQQSGATIVVAAGNEGTDTEEVIPAAYEQVITVSALSDFDGLPGGLAAETCVGPRGPERDDAFARYSNFGPSVDLIAPGTCIRSTARGSGVGGTKVMSGTSMATPHVTGAAARYIAGEVAAGHPRPSPDEVRTALRAAAGLDWDAATDPDGTPDRLLDVAALSGPPSITLAALPTTVTVPASAVPLVRSVDLELTRKGLFGGSVTLSTDTSPSAGIAARIDDTRLADPDQVSTILHLTIDDSVVEGDYPLVIHASASSVLDATANVTLHVDRTPPTVEGPLITMLGGTFGDVIPVQISWTSADASGSVVKNELRQKQGNGSFNPVGLSSPTATHAQRLMKPLTDYVWQVRSTDDSGNTSAWSPLDVRLGVRESNGHRITFSNPGVDWTTVYRATASGGSLASSSKAHAFAGATFHGRGVAWVAPLGPHKGKARVTLDGTSVIVDLHAASAKPRHLVFASGPLDPTLTHTLSITVISGIVDVDAILVVG